MQDELKIGKASFLSSSRPAAAKLCLGCCQACQGLACGFVAPWCRCWNRDLGRHLKFKFDVCIV